MKDKQLNEDFLAKSSERVNLATTHFIDALLAQNHGLNTSATVG